LGLNSQQLKELEIFFGFLKKNPQALYSQELHFLKDYLESLGAKIPPQEHKEVPPKTKEPHVTKEETKAEKTEESYPEEEQEPDPELVPADNDSPLETGDESKDVTDEQFEEATSIKIQAMEAQREAKFDEALSLFTKAIVTNPHAGILYASRAQLLLEMKKPNAAIRDCNTAIKIAPDSAKGYKIRGRANRLLGNYEAALRDYQQGQKLDFDDNTKKLEAEIKPRADKIIAKRARLERQEREKEKEQREKDIKERKEAIRKAREEEAKRQAEEQEEGNPFEQFGGMPGFGMPGGGGGSTGGMPFGMNPETLQQIMSDPEMLAAMQDPSFMAKLSDIQKNPENISKYQNDPTVKRLINKFSNMFGGGGSGGGAAAPNFGSDFPSASEDVD